MKALAHPSDISHSFWESRSGNLTDIEGDRVLPRFSPPTPRGDPIPHLT